MRVDPFVLHEILRHYLMEDLGHGDITTCAIPNADREFKALIKAKEPGVLAGILVIRELFRLLEPKVEIKIMLNDGDFFEAGEEIAYLKGPALALLRGERIALNILQRLSGIATLTKKLADAISHTKAKLVDTRKTTPGFRLLEKYAVRVGGGFNHRMGLYDCAMIKENHIKVAGSIKSAIEAVRRSCPFTIRIEVEVRNLDELKEALEAEAELILLDNMELSMIEEAVKMAKGKALMEVSGGITPDNIVPIAEKGVDYISSGFIIHHAVWIDMNMKIQ